MDDVLLIAFLAAPIVGKILLALLVLGLIGSLFGSTTVVVVEKGRDQ